MLPTPVHVLTTQTSFAIIMDQGPDHGDLTPTDLTVGRGSPGEAVDGLHELFKDANLHEVYSRHPDVNFLYEILDTPGWRPRVREFIDEWIQNEANIRRAASSVGRPLPPPSDFDKLLQGFCPLKFKGRAGEQWKAPWRGLGIANHLPRPETVVIVALQDLDTGNGFFRTLRKGEDICLDGKARITFPPSGGGIGILFSLKL